MKRYALCLALAAALVAPAYAVADHSQSDTAIAAFAAPPLLDAASSSGLMNVPSYEVVLFLALPSSAAIAGSEVPACVGVSRAVPAALEMGPHYNLLALVVHDDPLADEVGGWPS